MESHGNWLLAQLNPSGKGEHTEVTESRDDGSGDNGDDRKGEDDPKAKMILTTATTVILPAMMATGTRATMTMMMTLPTVIAVTMKAMAIATSRNSPAYRNRVSIVEFISLQ